MSCSSRLNDKIAGPDDEDEDEPEFDVEVGVDIDTATEKGGQDMPSVFIIRSKSSLELRS